jgi:hypothetical protein
MADKRVLFETLLAQGPAFLHLDARRPGVRLPSNLLLDAHVVLQYGYALAIPIPDLAISDWGVRATLSFQRSPFVTAVPWSAVYGVHGAGGKGELWPGDVPPEVTNATLRATADSTPPADESAKPDPPSPPAKPSHLKLVN